MDTVVVGAGVAGLTAARLLAHAGQEVVVLEARDRIGGRIWSVRSPDRVLDLGASWIHGVTDNPVAGAAAGFGLPTVEFTVGSYQAGGRPIAYHDPDGRRMSEPEVAAFVADVAAVDAALVDEIDRSGPGASYRDVTERALGVLGADPARVARVRHHLEHRTEEQLGVWITDLAAHGLDDDAPDGDEVIFPGGYGRLADRLAGGLDVRLGRRVEAVHWSSEGVEVVTAEGSVHGAAAVVTVPVGVLPQVDFEPALPEHHRRCLDALAMNAFEKVVLRFDSRFWGEDVYAIRQLGPQGHWWHSWYDLTVVDGTPTLLTFAAGPAAEGIRGWSDAEVVASVMEQLRRLYGDAVEDPVDVRVTAWHADPYTRGSYSYLRVGGRKSDHDDLADPIGGVLHLAGEATWSDDSATVTGALLSGHRAAERILGRPVPIETLWLG